MNDRRLLFSAECGIFLALGLALSHFKLFQMPSGGSVSLGSLPVMLFAARWGVKSGLFCGTLMGLLLLSVRPFVLTPVQFLLDYPLAYGSLGLSGLCEWKTKTAIISAVSIAEGMKLIFHTFAGVVFFCKDMNLQAALPASLIYNISHVLPEAAICLAVILFLRSNHFKILQRFR